MCGSKNKMMQMNLFTKQKLTDIENEFLVTRNEGLGWEE